MPLMPITSGDVSVAVGGAAGTGATAVLTAAARQGTRGQCLVTTGSAALAAGVLATVTFTAPLALPDDFRVISLMCSVALPAGVSVNVVPTFNAQRNITGFTIQASAALTASTQYQFTWAED